MPFSEIQVRDGSIDEKKLIYKFDQLVADGIVQYSSTQRAHRSEDKGMPIEIIVSSALAAKPQLGETLQDRFKKPERKLTGKSLLSDIDVTGHEIGLVNKTHLLAYNKFCGYRPHLMLLTDDPLRRQTDDLDFADIGSLWGVLNSLGREYVGMYNCGAAAGCSRMHRHMQLVPRPDDFVLWPDLVGWERPPLPFVFYEEALSPRMSARAVYRIYEQLVQDARDAAAVFDRPLPHNLLLTRHWMVLIPRSANGHRGVTMNAAGFLGMTWTANEGQPKLWADVGPLNAMEHCGVSARV